MNRLRREGRAHSSERPCEHPEETHHAVLPGTDCLELLRRLPDRTVQLIVCDPPYNLDIAEWDRRRDYVGMVQLRPRSEPGVLRYR